MRRMLIMCLFAAPIFFATGAHASRCVDSVDMFAQQIDVPIGAPDPRKGLRPNSHRNLDREMDASTMIPPQAGIGAPVPPKASMEGAPTSQLSGALPKPASSKFDGKELKANAKAVLSMLLNQALAAGEEGQSWSCFKKLNHARAVVLNTAASAWADGDNNSDWR